MKKHTISTKKLKVDLIDALRYAGYRGLENAHEDEVVHAMEKAIERCRKLSSPMYLYEYFPYDRERGLIKADREIVLQGNDIRDFLGDCEGIIILAATLGFGPDAEQLKLKAEGIYEMTIFDGASSALIEGLTDYAEDEIFHEEREKGKTVRGRYSPGYGDFPLTFQKEIERLLGIKSRLGISLSDSLMMTPMKSVTALFAVYDRIIELGDRREHTIEKCMTCKAKCSCPFRKHL